MDASLWIAKTGLTAQQTRMQVISNNLANVNTTGFKKDRAVFEVYVANGLATGYRYQSHGHRKAAYTGQYDHYGKRT